MRPDDRRFIRWGQALTSKHFGSGAPRPRPGGHSTTRIQHRRSFVEAEVGKDRETVLMQWTRDSACRFFPLVKHPDFGLCAPPI